MAAPELSKRGAAPSRGRFANTGNGPSLQVVDIGHADYTSVVDADTAFWALVPKDRLAEVFNGDGKLRAEYQKKSKRFA